MIKNLGEEMNILVLAVLDPLDEAGAKRLHEIVIAEVNMTPVLQPAVWRYPILGDIGGVGETIVQPFVYAQPLAESISMNLPGVSVSDTWHEHKGFFLILCSCRPFNGARVMRKLKRLKWNVVDIDYCRVELVKKKRSWLSRKLWGD